MNSRSKVVSLSLQRELYILFRWFTRNIIDVAQKYWNRFSNREFLEIMGFFEFLGVNFQSNVTRRNATTLTGTMTGIMNIL